MKAIIYEKFGGSDVLHFGAASDPVVGNDSVLVAVKAASLNVIDTRTREGLMRPLVNTKFPKIPGSDFAGIVLSVGKNVTGFKIGEAVFGASDPLKGGSFAERIAVPASQLATKPESLSFEQAAALPVTGLAALYALRELGQAKRGQSVLIHGAGGALGLFAVQIAKTMGLQVTAVARGKGLDLARQFGADRLIDYSKQDGTRFSQKFDIIFNASGKLPFGHAKSALTPSGRMIEPSPSIPVFIGSKIGNVFRRKKHLVLITIAKRQDLDHLVAMFASGDLHITIAKTYALENAADAFAEMEMGGLIGKLVVTM